jgi:hypothetical protein
MKRGRPELPLIGMNCGQRGVKIMVRASTGRRDSTAVSRCRNLPGLDAMILRHENFGKGYES